MSVSILGILQKRFKGKGLTDGSQLFHNVYSIQVNSDGSFTVLYKDENGLSHSFNISQSFGTSFLNKVPLGLTETQNTGITVSNADSSTVTGDALARSFATQASAAVSPASPGNIKDITLKLAPSTFATPQLNTGLEANKLYKASFEGTASFSSLRTVAGYIMLFALMKVTETRTNALVSSVGALLDYKLSGANEYYFKEVPLNVFDYERIFSADKTQLTALSVELSFYTITQSPAANYATDSLAALNYLKDLEKGVASPTEPTNLDNRYASTVFLKNAGVTFIQ